MIRKKWSSSQINRQNIQSKYFGLCIEICSLSECAKTSSFRLLIPISLYACRNRVIETDFLFLCIFVFEQSYLVVQILVVNLSLAVGRQQTTMICRSDILSFALSFISFSYLLNYINWLKKYFFFFFGLIGFPISCHSKWRFSWGNIIFWCYGKSAFSMLLFYKIYLCIYLSAFCLCLCSCSHTRLHLLLCL